MIEEDFTRVVLARKTKVHFPASFSMDFSVSCLILGLKPTLPITLDLARPSYKAQLDRAGPSSSSQAHAHLS
jgi:hypothetical protein